MVRCDSLRPLWVDHFLATDHSLQALWSNFVRWAKEGPKDNALSSKRSYFCSSSLTLFYTSDTSNTHWKRFIWHLSSLVQSSEPLRESEKWPNFSCRNSRNSLSCQNFSLLVVALQNWIWLILRLSSPLLSLEAFELWCLVSNKFSFCVMKYSLLVVLDFQKRQGNMKTKQNLLFFSVCH